MRKSSKQLIHEELVEIVELGIDFARIGQIFGIFAVVEVTSIFSVFFDLRKYNFIVFAHRLLQLELLAILRSEDEFAVLIERSLLHRFEGIFEVFVKLNRGEGEFLLTFTAQEIVFKIHVAVIFFGIEDNFLLDLGKLLNAVMGRKSCRDGGRDGRRVLD